MFARKRHPVGQVTCNWKAVRRRVFVIRVFVCFRFLLRSGFEGWHLVLCLVLLWFPEELRGRPKHSARASRALPPRLDPEKVCSSRSVCERETEREREKASAAVAFGLFRSVEAARGTRARFSCFSLLRSRLFFHSDNRTENKRQLFCLSLSASLFRFSTLSADSIPPKRKGNKNGFACTPPTKEKKKAPRIITRTLFTSSPPPPL